ncbi:hypothetical protein [Bacillus salacetis]|uniref:hypothetical protein n=1 Tax=Bacillus salacetis TaxID=2315464 RepID=UPI001443C035|nr:hypothetical protein [Bacillus salacetis]
MVNTDAEKVAKLSNEHKSAYPGNKHIKQNKGSEYGPQRTENTLPIVLEEE